MAMRAARNVASRDPATAEPILEPCVTIGGVFVSLADQFSVLLWYASPQNGNPAEIGLAIHDAELGLLGMALRHESQGHTNQLAIAEDAERGQVRHAA